MCAYRSPSITIVNQYEPLVSPVVGGDRQLAIVGEQNVTNLELYPTQIIEARRSLILPDVLEFSKLEVVLGVISELNRVTRVWQGSKNYSRILPSNSAYIKTVTSAGTGSPDVVNYSTLTAPATGFDVIAVYANDGSSFTRYNVYGGSVDSPGYTPVLAIGSGLNVTLTWHGVNPAGQVLTVVVADATVGDYYVGVDDFSDLEKVTTYTYWNTKSPTTPPAGSVYRLEARMEFPGERLLYTSFDDVVKDYGPIIDSTQDFTDPTAINSLVLAANIAFREGAPSIMLVPYSAPTVLLATALEHLATDDTVNIVTILDARSPTSGGTTPADLLRNHVVDASAESSQKFRVAILQPTVGNFNAAYNTTDDTAYNQMPPAYNQMTPVCNSIRVFVVGPSQLNFNIAMPGTGEYKEFKSDGIYGAVVYGAMMTRLEYDVATAMLKKESRTITKIRTTQLWDDIKMDMIAALGIILFAKVNGTYKVRDDITTNQDGLLLKNEPSITMVADNIARSAIDALDVGIIGGKLKLPTTLETVKSLLISLLSKKADDEIIQTFGSPVVQVDVNDPRRILVVVPIVPMFKTREIKITFSYVSTL